jgi:hypothetical protein
MCSSLSTSPPGESVSESTSGDRLCVREHDLVPLRAPKAGQKRHLACSDGGRVTFDAFGRLDRATQRALREEGERMEVLHA